MLYNINENPGQDFGHSMLQLDGVFRVCKKIRLASGGISERHYLKSGTLS